MFIPNQPVTHRVRSLILIGWVVLLTLVWMVFKPTIFPNPLEIVQALPELWNDGLASELMSSFMINLEALVLSSVIGLPLAYLSRVPIIAPACELLAKLRFVGSGVFFLPLVLLLPSGHDVKLALLTLGELFYLVTTMMGVVQELPNYRFDDARTLKMGEWLSIWYVVIRGTVGEAISAIRDNAAMGWSMLMFVEGIVRSEGGVGVMLINQQKHLNLSSVWALILVVLLTGIAQDYFLTSVKKAACPYAV